jgi:hypothetical protein
MNKEQSYCATQLPKKSYKIFAPEAHVSRSPPTFLLVTKGQKDKKTKRHKNTCSGEQTGETDTVEAVGEEGVEARRAA